MSEVNEMASKRSKRSDAKQDLLLSDTAQDLLQQYGCGPIQFSGTNDALYERHLLFDDIVAPAAAAAREQFEAAARSARDILSQRWVRTDSTYDRENPKRIYYLSMEFLIGRSLTNNVTNLLLDPFVQRAVRERNLDWLGLLDQEPDAGLGNGGLGRLAACFLDSMATMQLPAMGYGLRYEYGMFRQSIEDGWQRERPDNWLRHPDPWEVARPEVDADRHAVRPPRRRLRGEDDQYPPSLGRCGAGLLRLPGVQPRRLRRCARGDARGRIVDPGALSRRLDDIRPGVAL